MRISAINNQQNYNNNVNFQGKGRGKAGAVLGGLTGLMMSGAIAVTAPVHWSKIKTLPIVVAALTVSGVLEGKMIEDVFFKEKDDNDEKKEH